MFGGARRRVTGTTTEAALPLVRIVEMTHGLPPGFWDDPYVLGFLHGVIGIFTRMAGGRDFSSEDKGRVLIDTFSNISGQDGMTITRKVLALTQAKDPDYVAAVHNADKLLSITYGIPGYENDPDVLEASKNAEGLAAISADLGIVSSSDSPNAAITGALQMRLYYDVVVKRFGL